jgi:hypothetical protein
MKFENVWSDKVSQEQCLLQEDLKRYLSTLCFTAVEMQVVSAAERGRECLKLVILIALVVSQEVALL